MRAERHSRFYARSNARLLPSLSIKKIVNKFYLVLYVCKIFLVLKVLETYVNQTRPFPLSSLGARKEACGTSSAWNRALATLGTTISSLSDVAPL